MVSSKAYPDLDRSPKKNWVESAGGLPDYIERIAKHIHYEGGKSISQAISMAISQVKKWAAGGEGVSAKTQALAAKAVAAWEKLKASNKAKQAVQMTAERIEAQCIELSLVIGLSIVEDKTGRPPKPMKSEEIARLRAKVRAKKATPAERKRLAQLLAGGEKKPTELAAKRGPYKQHVAHTRQFGKKKGDLSEPADWQHPYQPKTKVAGALKAKHLSTKDLGPSGQPKADKVGQLNKPLPASATITGRKEQRTGAETARKAAPPKGPKPVKKPPAVATLRAKRNTLAAKVTAGTATPAEKTQLNKIISQLKAAKTG